jgi:hypothetical protein
MKSVKFKGKKYNVDAEGFTFNILKMLKPEATETDFEELTGRKVEFAKEEFVKEKDTPEFTEQMDVAIKNMRKDVQKVSTQKKVQSSKPRDKKL